MVIDDDLIDRRFLWVGTDGTAVGWLYGSSRVLLFLGNIANCEEEIRRVVCEKSEPGDTIIVDRMAGWEWEKRFSIDGIEGRSGVWRLA